MINFPELVITGKYVKIRFKNSGHHAIFLVLEINRSKILTKHIFKTKTDVAQNLIDNFFSNFDCQRTFPQERF